MPLVTTMVTLHLLGDGVGPLPFTDPELLRSLLRSALDVNDPALPPAVALADRMEQLLADYLEQVDASINDWVEESKSRYVDTEAVTARLHASDRERLEVTNQIIALRQELLELLNEAQWEAVFSQRAARGLLPL